MQVKKYKDRTRLVDAAMDRIPSDLTITNVQLVNVVTGEIYPAEVDIIDGVIDRVREAGTGKQLPSRQIYDGGGRYLLPGCFDAHLHIESTMMIPENFGRAAVRCGTTSVIHDPHEIANVMGMEGVRFMLENAKSSPIRTWALVPTCLPSVEGAEGNGAVFTEKEVRELLEEEGVLGLAEVMDFIGVTADTPRMHAILDAGLRKDAFIQGHCPGVTGKMLDAYMAAGPVSCHESDSARQVRQKLRNGMYVELQSSSLSVGKLPALLEGLEGMRYTDRVALCTDDIHVKDILETGHVNRVIKHALALGVDPVEAYRYATYNAAREFGFTDVGAVGPGFVADLQLLDALDGRNPYAVFVGGTAVVENFELTDRRRSPRFDFPRTVHMPQITGPESFLLKAPAGCGDRVRTTVLEGAGSVICTCFEKELPVRDGCVSLEEDPDLCFVAVVNRYGSGDMTVAVRRGFGLEKGAFASTVSHDCHNFSIVYRSPEDAFACAAALSEAGGGICCALGGEVKSLLPLPVAGVMSELPAEEVAAAASRTESAIDELCGGRTGMLVKTSVMALACMPGVVVTDRGLYDGLHSRFLPVFPE